jgi:hypothetical protein
MSISFQPRLQTLRTFLLAPDMPLWRYCLLAFLLSLIPGIMLVATLYGIVAWVGIDTTGLQAPEIHATLRDAIGSILIGPAAETLLLALGLKALSTMTQRTSLIVTASALAWGCLHATRGFMWLFGPTWSFFVFSCAYLAWRKKSFGQAFLAAAVPHALGNASALTFIYFAERLG